MGWLEKLKDKMEIFFDDDDTRYGTITMRNNRYYLGDRELDERYIDRVENNRLYLKRDAMSFYGLKRGAAAQTAVGTEQEIRVPVHEERLSATTRPVEAGYVEVEKNVVEERQTVGVDVSFERAHVEQRNTPDRRVDATDAFKEGTIRVPLKGEEVIAQKEIVQTGEVVVNKERVTEQQQVSDTVRKEHVEVDEHYNEALPAFRQFHESQKSGQRFEDAELFYRSGYTAARDPRFKGKKFEQAAPEIRRSLGGRYQSDDEWQKILNAVRQGYDYNNPPR